MSFDLLRTQLYVDRYIELLHKYRYIQRPLYCLYLSVNLTNSTIQEGMFQGASYQPIGPYSPLRYNAIHNYPLSLFSPSYTKSTIGGETGIFNETELECIFINYDNVGLIPSLLDLCVISYPNNETINYRPLLPVWSVSNIERLSVHVSYTLFKLKLMNSGNYFRHLQSMWSTQVTRELWFDEIEKRLYTQPIKQMLDSMRQKIEQTVEMYNKTHGITAYVNRIGISGFYI